MGTAKFDKSKKCLVVTLPVIPGEVPKLPIFFDDPMKDQDNSDLPPLIEELPAIEKESYKDASLRQLDSETLGDDSDQAVAIDDPSAIMSNTDECKQADTSFILPHYNFKQDNESITFIFYARNISVDTLSISFPSNGVFQTKFKSVGSGGYPIYYSFYANFGEGFKLVGEDFIKDVSDKNLTITLLKLRECQTMWDKFYAGVNEKNVEEQLFLTTDNLQLHLDKLQSEGEKMVHTDEQIPYTEAIQIKVSEMNQKKLTLQIRKREACLNEEDELDDIGDSAQSAANIEVIHTTPPPDIQGILKQRSVSESSETSSGDSPTGTSLIDSDGTKRSVTFNSQVDKTTFKVNASVKSMQQALKSKRRRNRKKEEKQKEKNNRRRHYSNGSEGSSCDDVDTRHSSESLSEEDHEQDDTVENFEETGKEMENFDVMNNQKSEKVETNLKELKETHGEEMKGKDVKHDKVVCKQPGYQIHSENKNEMERKSKLVLQVKNKMAKQKQEKDIDDSDDDDDDMKAERTFNVNGKNDVMTHDENDKEMLYKTSGLSDNDKNGKKSAIIISIDAKSKCDNGRMGMASESPNDPTLQQRAMKKNNIQEKDETFSKPEISIVDQAAGGNNNERNKEPIKSDVETALSWKEVDCNDPNNEHKTRCAVNFANNVMFDLDIN